jgi:hypothetical protein
VYQEGVQAKVRRNAFFGISTKSVIIRFMASITSLYFIIFGEHVVEGDTVCSDHVIFLLLFKAGYLVLQTMYLAITNQASHLTATI